MEFYQKDPQQGVHLVTVLKSPGGYSKDGLHYFKAHEYLVPGRFTVRFGLNTRGQRRFGRVRKVAYETVVRDPGAYMSVPQGVYAESPDRQSVYDVLAELEEIEAEMARIAALKRQHLSSRDERFIRSLKPTCVPSLAACADIAKAIDKDVEAVKVPRRAACAASPWSN